MLQSWQLWAVLSAVFAALTAVFAKIGVSEINSNLATFIRTVVVLLALFFIVLSNGLLKFESLATLQGKTLWFLLLSGLATGASWLCYFHALKIGDACRVAPVDKLSVVLVAIFSVVFLGESLSLLNWLGISLITIGVILTLF
ncbi:MAG: EamA family transporter [Deltaproteobacteria bacterium]